MKSEAGMLCQFVKCKCDLVVLCESFTYKEGDLLSHSKQEQMGDTNLI